VLDADVFVVKADSPYKTVAVALTDTLFGRGIG